MGPSYKSVLVSIQFIESGDKCNLFSVNSRNYVADVIRMKGRIQWPGKVLIKLILESALVT